MNLVRFCLGRLGRQGSSKNFCSFAKILLRVYFSYFHGQNKSKIRVSIHCILRTKKWINIRVRKLKNFASNYTFLGQNSTKNLFHVPEHGLRTPNEGINLKIWADVADKICFGRT